MPTLKESEATFTPLPAGNHPARCFSVVAIGTQASQNPLYKPQPQFIVTFEVPGETIEQGGETRPMIIGQFCNAYFGRADKPSNTRKFIESWRGKAFTDVEMKGFSTDKLIGAPCMLNVIHETKNGKTREKIASISPLPKGLALPPQFHKSVAYEIEMGRNDIFNALPEWVRKKIEGCEEWTQPQAHNEDAAANNAADAAAGEQKDSSIPF